MNTHEPFISDAYREQNVALLSGSSGFGCGGKRNVDKVLAWADELGASSLLDYGCGRGILTQELRRAGWDQTIVEYDPAIPGKTTIPTTPCDLVVCADVLEHVETDRLSSVLAHIRRLSRLGAYLVIASRLSNKRLPDGRNAHLTVRSVDWWLGRLEADWKIHRFVRHVKPERGERGVTVWLRSV